MASKEPDQADSNIKDTTKNPTHHSLPMKWVLYALLGAALLGLIILGVVAFTGSDDSGDGTQDSSESIEQSNNRVDSSTLFGQLADSATSDEERLRYDRLTASSLADEGDSEGAIILYKQIIEKSNNPKDLEALSTLYLNLGDDANYNKYLDLALEGYNQDPEKYADEIQSLTNGEWEEADEFGE